VASLTPVDLLRPVCARAGKAEMLVGVVVPFEGASRWEWRDEEIRRCELDVVVALRECKCFTEELEDDRAGSRRAACAPVMDLTLAAFDRSQLSDRREFLK
jgi:hypothetical protein